MTKTLNHIIFFPPPKSESFFQQHWESEYFFRKKHTPPPFKLNGRSLSDSYLGMKIGNVNCNASACADDVALMSRRKHETQVMINIAHEFATMEGYKLQPAKSVIINIQPNKRKQSMMDQEYILGNNVMPNVKQAIHLGIIRTNTLVADNMTVNVEENIKKRLWFIWRRIPWQQWTIS